MSNREPIMRLENVGVSFKSGGSLFRSKTLWALKNVTFNLYRGETLGIVGRNGSGKSTLMRLIAGIYSADRGELWREDFTASLLQLQVGFNPHLTGRQNAVLSGILLGLRKSQAVSRLRQVEEFSGLEEFMDEPVRTYSSGMKARLGFAVAWQADPDVLLVDEVLGVGDYDFKRKSSKLMRERMHSGKTAVLVAHQPNTVAELCDRVVWIEKGETVMEGAPAVVLSEYRKASSVAEKVSKKKAGKKKAGKKRARSKAARKKTVGKSRETH